MVATRLRTGSKYFKFISDDTIESQVLNNSGTVANCPKLWGYKNVIIQYPDGYSETKQVKQNTSRTFVTTPHIYGGSRVFITLLK